MILNRLFGPYAPLYWGLLLCNVLVPQVLWFWRVRSNVKALFVVALVVNIGMWLERFIIVVTSLHRDFLPSSWGMYYPTVWDWATYVGIDRAVLRAAVPVPPLSADDLHLRDARACVGGRGQERTMKTLIAYGE